MHLLSHHRKEGEQDPVDVPYSNGEKYSLYFHCDKCEKKYSDRYVLNRHIKVSLKIFDSIH